MSAIAGVVFFNGVHVTPGTVEKMTQAMAARGPDGRAHWYSTQVALGHCMLCTTPESLHEKQPLANEDASCVLVWAGRVDNRDELRKELLLRGAVLRDNTDAELVLRAWQQWGQQSPERIIGDFVYFIWDAVNQQLFGARDVAGNRHFYYASGDGWFAFASETRALLGTALIQPRFNKDRLLDYMTGEYDRFDDVGTFYQNISRLPLAHAMTVSAAGLKTWRYWHPENLADLSFSSQAQCREAFLEQLRVAVKCRLRAIGPVGACLSGGAGFFVNCGTDQQRISRRAFATAAYFFTGPGRQAKLSRLAIYPANAGGWLGSAHHIVIEPHRRPVSEVSGVN